VSIKWVKSV